MGAPLTEAVLVACLPPCERGVRALQASELMDSLKKNLRQEHVLIHDFLSTFYTQVQHFGQENPTQVAKPGGTLVLSRCAGPVGNALSKSVGRSPPAQSLFVGGVADMASTDTPCRAACMTGDHEVSLSCEAFVWASWHRC